MWMARATTSLPEPDAPQIITDADDRATRFTISRSATIGALVPISMSSMAQDAVLLATAVMVAILTFISRQAGGPEARFGEHGK